MNGINDHINLWAEKLEQVWIPSADQSWAEMTMILNKEMPVHKSKDWKRWLLLIIFLLLVLGICNCPGMLRKYRSAEQNNPAKTYQNKTQDNSSKNKTAEQKNNSIEKPASQTDINSKDDIKNDIDRGKKTGNNHHTKNNTSSNTSYNISKNDIPNKQQDSKQQPVAFSDTHTNKSSVRKHNTANATGSNVQQHHKKYNNKQKEPADDIAGNNQKIKNNKKKNDIEKNSDEDKTGTVNPSPVDQSPEKNDSSSRQNTISNAVKKKDSIAQRKKVLRDSAAAKAKEPDKAKEIEKGWAAGIGLNQFFPVGGQQKSNFNSSGTTGTISDYIPVPMVRYYFRKQLYAQLEVQFNVPQYTQKLLASENIDPLTATNKSAYIKKLYYFNVPLSIHYSPVKNVYLGAGLQYSKLKSGVATFETRTIVPPGGGNDTLKSSTVAKFKIGDSSSIPVTTSEWRFLVDVNYQWKKLVLGARYNQALSKFIDVHLPNTQITQARNSSLQLYLRYILWENKKKKKKSPAK